MQKHAAFALSAVAAIGLAASPAMARTRTWHKPMHHHAEATASMPKADVIARDARGRATKVRVDGKDYAVCTAKVTDDCIQPRQAGLHWGDTPMKNWPGKPASDDRAKPPAHKPAAG
ncbi:MAG: hypothetical protein KGL48_01710 [Sphingomonadales bacterium]|nr:hypothetical protein [Sphingomonadales bacterium]MDE2569422.1 hypothetical protein [Sphingomonadales bacterium]